MMSKQLEQLIDAYTREHNLTAGQVQVYRNRHHTSCGSYGGKNFTRCDCLSVPKLTLLGASGLKVHEVFDLESGEVAYIIEF